jgi:hypothetical protein
MEIPIIFNCKFCNKKFSNKQNLRKHIETAKYCLEARGIKDYIIFTCEFCSCTFTQKINLTTHLKICQIRIEKNHSTEIEGFKKALDEEKIIISELKKHIRELELELAKKEGYVAGIEKAKPTITKNKIYNQKILNIKTTTIKPFTAELVRRNVYKYDFESFFGGILQLSQFISDMIVLETDEGKERNFVCTDASRNSFHRLISSEKEINKNPDPIVEEIMPNGIWQMDREALYLNNVFDELKLNIESHYDKFLILQKENDDYLFKSSEMIAIYLGIKGNYGSKMRKDLVIQVRDIDNGVKSVASI